LAYSSQSASISELVAHVNDAISNLVVDGMFVTAFFGMIDSEAKTLQYVNAGHLSTLLLRPAAEKLEELESTQFPLGVDEGFEFDAQEIPIEVGDRILMYTDGIMEATNEKSEQFGMPRIKDAFLTRCDKDLEFVVDSLMQDLITFRGHDMFDDDVNLVACEVVA